MKQNKVCTQCGACLAECPVFALKQSEEYSPKAKQTLMYKAWDDDGKLHWEKMIDLTGNCTSCERCKLACARRLSVPEALSDARARHPRWQQYFWKEWIANGKLLWPIASTMAPVVPNKFLPTKLAIMHAAALAMKEPAPLKPWLRLVPDANSAVSGQSFVIFGGCTATRLRPVWEEKTKNYVQALGGMIVTGNDFKCCGGTYHHAGMNDAAIKVASHNVQVWKQLGMPKIVVFCISCLHSLKDYASMPGVLIGSDAEAWTKALMPLSNILRDAKVEVMPNAPKSYAYHSPCHWSGKDADAEFLGAALQGLQKGKAKCCGFGGVLKMINPTLSKDLADRCWEGLSSKDTKEEHVVLTGCSGCTMQLNAHAPENASAYHWLDCMQ